jgi:hypothetical protein
MTLAGFLSRTNPKNRKTIKLKLRSFPLVILLSCLATSWCLSQDVPAKIDAFNETIGKEYNVFNKGRLLIIEGFREGKHVKTDKINVYDLDFKTLKFSENDKSVSVKCYSDLDGCVNRVLSLNKKKSYKQRIVFGISEGIDGEEVKNKLRLLLNDMAKKY